MRGRKEEKKGEEGRKVGWVMHGDGIMSHNFPSSPQGGKLDAWNEVL